MGRRRHKRKNSHVVIVTSDAADADLRQFHIRPWILQTFVLLLCIGLGGLIGFFVFEDGIRKTEEDETRNQQETIDILMEEKAQLEEEIATLNDTVQILSDTVNQKTQAESELLEQIQMQSIPTKPPLKGIAGIEEPTGEGDPICEFTAASGAMVVATASGTVSVVSDDAEYGQSITIDHGNGYMTVYRSKGEAKVKQGEVVTQGTTLFLIGEDNGKLGYQMIKDGVFIDPLEVLVISG